MRNASPSFPAGSFCEPAFTQTSKAMKGEPGSASVMVPAGAAPSPVQADATPTARPSAATNAMVFMVCAPPAAG